MRPLPRRHQHWPKIISSSRKLSSRAEGWGSWEHGREWTNYCPRCVEAGDLDFDRAGIGFTKKWMAKND
jgi:hypothetical protein